MRETEPKVYLISRPQVDYGALGDYLDSIGASNWLDAHDEPGNDTNDLIEAAGRICYRSWQPGLNPNVTQVRTDQRAYLRNILASSHGSVLEHASFSFVLADVTRTFTHELVRHRVGVGISQESLRYVRLEQIPVWVPLWAQRDHSVMEKIVPLIDRMEEFQTWAAEYFGLDEEGVDFAEKKHKTSFMRRFAPEGVSTHVLWTANVRTLRHVIETRTAEGAEEEMRLVFGKIAGVLQGEAPALFGDFTRQEDGSWIPQWRKV